MNMFTSDQGLLGLIHVGVELCGMQEDITCTTLWGDLGETEQSKNYEVWR